MGKLTDLVASIEPRARQSFLTKLTPQIAAELYEIKRRLHAGELKQHQTATAIAKKIAPEVDTSVANFTRWLQDANNEQATASPAGYAKPQAKAGNQRTREAPGKSR